MNLPFRKQGGEQTPVIPEMNAPAPPANGNSGIRWERVVVLVIVSALVLIFLFWAIRGIVHKVSQDNPKPKVSTSTNDKKGKKPPTKSSPTSNIPSSSNPSTPPSSSSTSTSQPETSGNGTLASTGPTTTTLANTGPAETAAVFTIATAAGLISYQVITRRRSSKN